MSQLTERIEEIAKRNPGVNLELLKNSMATDEKLRSRGVKKKQYELGLPFTGKISPKQGKNWSRSPKD